MIIAVDFDGTLHDGEWPGIGDPLPGAIWTMRRIMKDGHFLIIWTCREGKYKTEMYDWLKIYDIPFDDINCHCVELIEKFGYESRKIYADVYIDDRNLGGLPSWYEIYDIINGKMKPYWIYK